MSGDLLSKAEKELNRLLGCMKTYGITDVDLIKIEHTDPHFYTGVYQHKITKVANIWDVEFYKGEICKRYWNGSSCSSPEWRDFLTEEYELTVRKV